MNNYTESQIIDITEREMKGLEMLKELNLVPSAIVSKINLTEDSFADKVQAYLRDTKYVKQGDIYVESNLEESIGIPTE